MPRKSKANAKSKSKSRSRPPGYVHRVRNKTNRKRTGSTKRRKTLKSTASELRDKKLKKMLITSEKTHKILKENAGNHSFNEKAKMLTHLYTRNLHTI